MTTSQNSWMGEGLGVNLDSLTVSEPNKSAQIKDRSISIDISTKLGNYSPFQASKPCSND